MTSSRILATTLGLLTTLGCYEQAFAHPVVDGVPGRPDAIVDLATKEGVALVKAQWRYSDAKVGEIDSQGVGADLRATGEPNRTYDITPHAGAADYDDSAWDAIEPAELETRRSGGKVCFAWYRVDVTVPERIGAFPTAGSTAVFEIVVDDYAEVWVDGRLPHVLGQTGGPLVKGFNAPNRVVLTRDARPGQRFQLAVFAMNGPLSDPPGNFIWVRSATLDFYSREKARVGKPVEAKIERLDPAIDDIVPRDFVVEQIAGGFSFVEGPVWVAATLPDTEGYLLFSDPNDNVIYRWSESSGISVYRTKSGYAGADIGEYGQPGSNGLTLDREGRLTIDEHGRRRVVRQEKNGQITVLADRYDSKRLNSPNDLVYKSDGSLYFTDPPFGLPKFYDDPRREQPHFGVYRAADGNVQLVSTDLKGPNGIAFSPDEKYLYVTNWDTAKKVVMRYDVQSAGTLTNGTVFFDMTSAPGEEALDGLKIDKRGNLYASGPGGVWIISAAGKHLGTLVTPQLPANFAWGDADGKALYMTARSSLYRVRLGVEGVRPQLK